MQTTPLVFISKHVGNHFRRLWISEYRVWVNMPMPIVELGTFLHTRTALHKLVTDVFGIAKNGHTTFVFCHKKFMNPGSCSTSSLISISHFLTDLCQYFNHKQMQRNTRNVLNEVCGSSKPDNNIKVIRRVKCLQRLPAYNYPCRARRPEQSLENSLWPLCCWLVHPAPSVRDGTINTCGWASSYMVVKKRCISTWDALEIDRPVLLYHLLYSSIRVFFAFHQYMYLIRASIV